MLRGFLLVLNRLAGVYAALCPDQRASGCIFRYLILTGEYLLIVSEKSPPTTSFLRERKSMSR